jgi:hypothetical protein
MRGCLIALGIPVGLVVLVVALFWLNYYDVHVRYRLTVEVQDGDQIKTGSSVIDASYDIDPGWIWEGPNTHLSSFVGYAPTVDLGGKGMLFLTFVNATRTPDQIRAGNKQFFCAMDDMWCLPFAAYGKPGTGINTNRDNRKAALDQLLRQKGPHDVPFAVLPELARFLDINDPLTLAPVSPDDLAAGFGQGVELKRVILELTHEPVTPSPAIWPQWLTEKGYLYDYDGILFRMPKR